MNIPNLTIYKRESFAKYKTGEPRYIQTIKVINNGFSSRYGLPFRLDDGEHAGHFATIEKAKRAVSDNSFAYTRWEKSLICPECESEVTQHITDYADFRCENGHCWTRFGEKSIKHLK